VVATGGAHVPRAGPHQQCVGRGGLTWRGCFRLQFLTEYCANRVLKSCTKHSPRRGSDVILFVSVLETYFRPGLGPQCKDTAVFII